MSETFSSLRIQDVADTAALTLIGTDAQKGDCRVLLAALTAPQVNEGLGTIQVSPSATILPASTVISRARYLDNYLASSDVTADAAHARCIADMGNQGGKIRLGAFQNPATGTPWTFLASPNLPDATVWEGEGGHSVSISGQVFGSRPYTVLLTPGAALAAPATPGRFAGAATTGNSCAIRYLSIASSAARAIVGSGINDVVTAQMLYTLMRDRGGNGIESLGFQPNFEDLNVDGFQTGIWHAPAVTGGVAGNDPVLFNVRSHNWLGAYISQVFEKHHVTNLDHFPYMTNPNVNLPASAAWPCTIASDGATGTDITILTPGQGGGPSVGFPVDGVEVTICTQFNSSQPAYSTSNPTALFPGGVNRFGDPGLADAFWRNRNGVFVINLPTCAPNSFSKTPNLIRFLACGGTGGALQIDNVRALRVSGLSSTNAQVGFDINDSQLVFFDQFTAEQTGGAGDMTTGRTSIAGNSSGVQSFGGYGNACYVAEYVNVDAQTTTQPDYFVCGTRYETMPVGSSPVYISSGGVTMSGVFLGGTAATIGDTGGSQINIQTNGIAAVNTFLRIVGGSEFANATFQFNGSGTQPSNVAISADCGNIPSNIIPIGTQALTVAALASLYPTLPTADPHVVGAPWINVSVLSFSLG